MEKTIGKNPKPFNSNKTKNRGELHQHDKQYL
jgi:hypothetical protein